MRISCYLALGVLSVAWFPCPAVGQAVFSTDPNPLQRPVPLVVFKTGNATKVLDAVSTVLNENGFKLTRSDADRGELEAARDDSHSLGESDKVLVWLERDFERPKGSIKLYFVYGRFGKLVGHDQPVRIKLKPGDEDGHVASLKQAFVSLKF